MKGEGRVHAAASVVAREAIQADTMPAWDPLCAKVSVVKVFEVNSEESFVNFRNL